MKVVVLYESFFGNTRDIAVAIGSSLRDHDIWKGHVEVRVEEISSEDPLEFHPPQLLILGSPTRGFRPTPGIQQYLKMLPERALQEVRVAAFDTRIQLSTIKSGALRLLVDKGGYAARHIMKAMKRKGAVPVSAPEGFLVTGEHGPLQEGEVERAAEWARMILEATSRS